MNSARYHGHRFPPEIISYAVWVYHRFCMSFRDVEDLLAERGINSVVVHIPGAGHAVLPRSKCGQSIMSSFVDNPTASVDTSCVAQVAIPRFTTPAP